MKSTVFSFGSVITIVVVVVVVVVVVLCLLINVFFRSSC